MGYALGVDLGTTYTAAGVYRDGRVEIATLGNRSAAIPSVVLLKEDESILTGDAASRRGASEPGRVAREFKRRVGDSTPLFLGGSPYSAESLMAKLLAWVAGEVAAREGGPPEAVAVCHPANWGPYKKDLLAQAVRLADLGGAGLVSEPEAAAMHYASQERVAPGAVVAVYDLGGGTFDAAVLRKTGSGFEVLGDPEGIERLGGIDFDAAVFAHVARSLGGALDRLDEDDPAALAAVARLRQDCVEAKEALSTDTDTTIPVMLPGLQTEVRLTRSEFEAMIRPALGETIGAMRRALRSAGVAAQDVAKVLLVGGSSRIPLVAQLVGAELGRPVAVDAHPKHTIALGAALYAGAQGGLAGAAGPVEADAGDDAVSGAAAAGAGVGAAAVLGAAAVAHNIPVPPAPAVSTPTPTAPAPAAPPGPTARPPVPAPAAPSPVPVPTAPPPAPATPPAAAVAPTQPVPVPGAQPHVHTTPAPAPPGTGPRGGPPRKRKPPVAAIVAGLVVVAALAGGLAAILSSGGDSGGGEAFDAASTDEGAATSEVISVGDRPFRIAADDDAVWVTNALGNTVTRIDPATNQAAATIDVGGEPAGVDVNLGGAWVANYGGGTVLRIDPATDQIVATVAVGNGPRNVAATDAAVWVPVMDDDAVARIDPATDLVVATVAVGASPRGITATDTAVWVTNSDDGTVARIDPATNQVVATVTVGAAPGGVVTTDGAVWVANSDDNTVSRIDPDTNEVVDTIDVGTGPGGMAASATSVYVSNSGDDTVARIDPDSGEVTDLFDVGDGPGGLAVTAADLWVANTEDDTVSRLEP